MVSPTALRAEALNDLLSPRAFDALRDVAMETPGASKLVSVKLE